AAFIAFLLKGWCNGIALAAMRGGRDAYVMCRAYDKEMEDKSVYSLSADTRAYILSCEPWREDGFAQKLRRQFVRLPHQGVSSNGRA
ncbi:MAG TPA: hypothetical protein VFW00_08425, partial [Rhodocyclaceae bacterium]|nr:hypothetical protein [Rhodocyclaceae bacterium]